jgi:hypothetical protein
MRARILHMVLLLAGIAAVFAAVGGGLFVQEGAAFSRADQGTSSLQFTKRQLFVNPYESTAVGDLNKDGHVDIVYGAYWFAGPSFVPRTFRPNHVSKDYIRANSDHILDVDKDGWPDIIAGGWNEDGIYWYKNPGNGPTERGKPWEMHLPWEARLLAKTRGTMEMFALHDYDGDGQPELHSANYRKQNPLEVWRFTKGPDGQPALTPVVIGAEGGGHGYAWGDVNGDGREDVLTEIGWYERPAGDPFARPWTLHPETALPHPSCPFVVKDLNGDGRLDIIFGRGHDVGLFWWEQQAPQADGTTVWTRHVIDESWSQAHAISLADLDGDGADELVAGKCIWAHDGSDPGAADPPAIYYYTWNAATRTFTRHTIAAPGERIALGRQFNVADLNGDGRLDLTAPSKLGLWVLLNEGKAPARSSSTRNDAPCPRCERIFDGRTWDGWQHDPANWTIVGGAIRGFGAGSRSAFTLADYGSFRLIATSRMAPVNKDHLGVLFWGPRPEAGSIAYARNIQVQPPHGAMWDYFENRSLERQMLLPPTRDYEAWNTIEILANLANGSVRVAVDGREIMRYTDKDPSRLTKGPIGMQKHGAGGSEYKDIFVEADPTDDRLYTVR